MKLLTFYTIVLLLLFPFTAAAEIVTKMAFKDLPVGVQHTAFQEVSMGEINKIELIKEGKSTKYEIESGCNGENKDITIAPNGMLVEKEESVGIKQLPVELVNKIQKEYPDLKITEIERVHLVYFDLEGAQDGKQIKLKVFATGDVEEQGSQNTAQSSATQ